MADVELTNSLNDAFSQLVNKLEHIEQPLQEVAVVFGSSIKQNFREGGRPDRWTQSRRAKREGGQTLIDTGRLMKDSSMPQVQGKTIVLGSTLKYAAAMHFGINEDQTVKAHTRRVASRNTFTRIEAVSKKTGKTYKKRVIGSEGITFVGEFKRHMLIPARPIYILPDNDQARAGRIFERWMSQ